MSGRGGGKSAHPRLHDFGAAGKSRIRVGHNIPDADEEIGLQDFPIHLHRNLHRSNLDCTQIGNRSAVPKIMLGHLYFMADSLPDFFRQLFRCHHPMGARSREDFNILQRQARFLKIVKENRQYFLHRSIAGVVLEPE